MTQQREMPDRRQAVKMRTLSDSREFANAAIKLDIDAVLQRAKIISQIGATAAHMAGESLLRTGDKISEGVIAGGYNDVNTLMYPIVQDMGIDDAAVIFEQQATLDTIQTLASVSDDNALSTILKGFAAKRKYLEITQDGLVPQIDFEIPEPSSKKGCPMAAEQRKKYFDLFTARAIETYSAAYAADMPIDKIDQAKRFFAR